MWHFCTVVCRYTYKKCQMLISKMLLVIDPNYSRAIINRQLTQKFRVRRKVEMLDMWPLHRARVATRQSNHNLIKI